MIRGQGPLDPDEVDARIAEAKKAHAIEAHEDERLETHETETEDNVQCLHQYEHIEACKLCGDAFLVIDDVPYEVNHPGVRTR